jgi:lipopolysaccharide export system protein LptA
LFLFIFEKKYTLKKYTLLLFFIFSCSVWGQKDNTIKLVHADFTVSDQNEIPNAIIYTGNVSVIQNNIKINCNKAYHFTKENYIKAFGSVQMNQNDSLFLNSEYAEYNGDAELAFATGNVNMRSPDSSIKTDTIYFNKKSQVAYYNSYGTILNKNNTLKSKSGKYLINQKKYQFTSQVVVTNPQSVIKTNHLDYYENSGHAYVYGASTITNKNDYIYTENGFYDTQNNTAKLKNNSYIIYKTKRIEGDEIFYDRDKNYSILKNNIKVTDTLNKFVAKGHYAEVFQNPKTRNDSIILTKKALLISEVEKDSFYLHGKQIRIIGTPENRKIRAFNNVRFFKSDMSGKCDSIHSSNKTKLTQLIGRPVLWNNGSQLTGDVIHLIGNNKTNQMDSLKIINNSFIIQKDTLGTGFNQTKGVNLFGRLEDKKLKEVDIIKNTESIYFSYNDDKELIGIDKSICSRINMILEENQIEQITRFDNAEGITYIPENFPENARKLRGFIWRGDEKINSLEDIFPPEELEYDTKVKAIKISDEPMKILKETLEYDELQKTEKK